MKCPECDSEKTRVVDSRTDDDTPLVRRRRVCDDCKCSYTTVEVPFDRLKSLLELQAGVGTISATVLFGPNWRQKISRYGKDKEKEATKADATE